MPKTEKVPDSDKRDGGRMCEGRAEGQLLEGPYGRLER